MAQTRWTGAQSGDGELTVRRPVPHSIADVLRRTAQALQPRCTGCHQPAASGLCQTCARATYWQPGQPPELLRLPLPGSSATIELYYCGRYDGPCGTSPVALALKGWKDHDDRRSGRKLTRLLAARSHRLQREFDIVVPIPATSDQIRARGYLPSGWLARAVARSTKKPCRFAALHDRGTAAKQRGLGRSARLRNTQGRFSATTGEVASRRVLLIDDVATTGATLGAATSALERAGAAAVAALVLLRADRLNAAHVETTAEALPARSESD